MNNDSDSSHADSSDRLDPIKPERDGPDWDQPTRPPVGQGQNEIELSEDATLAPGSTERQSHHQPNVTEAGKLKSFGDYEIVGEIARGGMGVVYRGRQKSLNRDVAIKMILAGQFASQDEVDRFYTEAKAAANLDHPNVVPVYEMGQIEGHHFFSMKLIEGVDLGKKMGQLRDDLPTAVGILSRVCEAVHHAHQRGILHRDLKPGNILLDASNQPFVTDLGLARSTGDESNLTRTGAVLGTPSYMPPEQAAGNSDITTAADIYSLGAILYELLTGRPPFSGASPVETLMQVINEMPQRPSSISNVDRDLEAICLKCLAKDPSSRYATAADLASDLEAWEKGDPISVRAPSWITSTRFWLRQSFGSTIWALVIGPVMGLLSGASLWYSTIGFDTTRTLAAYEALPSAPIPFSLNVPVMPVWTQAPLMVLFAFSIVFVGYITARFVKPKHRGADLAAGTIVGMFASLAAFLFTLGPICILSLVQYEDIRMGYQVAIAENETTPFQVVEAYPELEHVARREQLNALFRKTESDHFYQIPRGLITGVILSLAIYFFPCLFETMVAGPIIRRHPHWYQSLPAYSEIAFPVVTLMTIVALTIGTYGVFGGSGFRWTLRLITLLAMIGVAIAAFRWRWHVVARIGVQCLLAATFVWFFAVDFPAVPGVSECNARVAYARRRIADNPNQIDARIELIQAYNNYASMLIQYERYSEASGMVEKMIDESDRLETDFADAPSGEDVESTIGLVQCQTRIKKVNLLIELDDLDAAKLLWEKCRDQYSGNLDLFATGVRLQKALNERKSQAASEQSDSN